MRVYEFLSPGAENAVSKVELMAALGLSDRELRRQVARERRLGFPILTSVEFGGYFAPSCPADITNFVRSMRHRARETAAIADAIELTLLDAMGQVTLGGWFDG